MGMNCQDRTLSLGAKIISNHSCLSGTTRRWTSLLRQHSMSKLSEDIGMSTNVLFLVVRVDNMCKPARVYS